MCSPYVGLFVLPRDAAAGVESKPTRQNRYALYYAYHTNKTDRPWPRVLHYSQTPKRHRQHPGVKAERTPMIATQPRSSQQFHFLHILGDTPGASFSSSNNDHSTGPRWAAPDRRVESPWVLLLLAMAHTPSSQRIYLPL